MGHIHQFKDFTIDTDQRVLLRDGEPVALAPKVFETLLALIENPGRIVLKEELMKRLWPDTFVEEANLTFNIQQLRKSLGDNARSPIYIQTIARRGYRFIAEMETLSDDDSENSEAPVNESYQTTPQAPLRGARPRLIAIVVVIIFAVTAIGMISWRFAVRGKRSTANNPGAVQAASSKALKLEGLTATGQSQYVAMSPDGKYVAYTRGSENSLGIWVRQLATNTNVEIAAAEGVSGLVFANSGESLYFVKGTPSALYRVSIIGGVPTKITIVLKATSQFQRMTVRSPLRVRS